MGRLSDPNIAWLLKALLAVAFVIALQPIVLAWLGRRPSASGKSFFEIPYIMWFLIHYGVSLMAIVVIAILGLTGVIDKTTIAALLGGLFGYVLGSSMAHHAKQDPTGQPPSSGATTTNQETPSA